MADPRKTLAKSDVKLEVFNKSHYGKFYEELPLINNEDEKTWLHRGQNFLVAYSELKKNSQLKRISQVDEYVVILHDAASKVLVQWENEEQVIEGEKVIFVPAGESRIQVLENTILTRLFTNNNQDLVDIAQNKDEYAIDHHHIPRFEPWPDPIDGFKIRSYDLNVAPDGKRFGSIYRCTTFMVNALDPYVGRRDATKLSPHDHDDFQQCSLAIEGEFIHHLRWPWTTNKNNWLDDEHELCKTPSIAIIPPGAIHTSEASGEGSNRLVDVFSPPRIDFSIQEGWVLNADEYPIPKGDE